jgi:hypothetical protein
VNACSRGARDHGALAGCSCSRHATAAAAVGEGVLPAGALRRADRPLIGVIGALCVSLAQGAGAHRRLRHKLAAKLKPYQKLQSFFVHDAPQSLPAP